MAWRPSGYLIEGELDNTKRGKVTGWMRFVGLSRNVTFDLKGDFHRDIRGTRIRFKGDHGGDASDARVTFPDAAAAGDQDTQFSAIGHDAILI